MEDESNYIGYLKYSGKLVEEGLLDTRKSAQALLGFDEAVRFFVNLQSPQLSNLEYEIPVKIKKGTWEILIPDTIGEWIQIAVGIVATRYISTAAKKLAENDFKEIGIKDIFRHSLYAIQWIIKIGKHVGKLTQKKFTSVRWRKENTEIGLPNDKGEYLFVPINYYNAFIESRPNLLSKISEIVNNERTLLIGIIQQNENEEETITELEKHIFYLKEDENDDILLPELVHGKPVELEGNITRGNEISNSVGFQYKDHILTCYPEKGSIVNFKKALFLKCRISGVINRQDKFGNITEKKPKIIFNKILPLENDAYDLPLFEKIS